MAFNVMRMFDDPWGTGRQLEQIQNERLYRNVLNQDGTSLYPDFSTWVKETLKITPHYAKKLIQISAAFSKDDVDNLGIAKCMQILRVKDPEKRAALLKRAYSSEGITVTELLELNRQRVQRERGNRYPVKREGRNRGQDPEFLSVWRSLIQDLANTNHPLAKRAKAALRKEPK